MTVEEKQLALNRHRAIVLATIDYLLIRLGGSFVYDQVDPVSDYYAKQKIQTEKYYQQSKLYRLQQLLRNLVKGLQTRADVGFETFIKEQTGYDIDIFDDIRRRVEVILAKNQIRSQQELNDVGIMLHYNQQTLADQELNEKFKTLVLDYSQWVNEPGRSVRSQQRSVAHSEIVSKVEKDGIEEVTIMFSKGFKPKFSQVQESLSPDKRRRLLVTQWNDGKNVSAYVAIVFDTASGAIFATNSLRPDVKASWKDNTTIVIEAKQDCTSTIKFTEVRNFNDVIRIEYIQSP